LKAQFWGLIDRRMKYVKYHNVSCHFLELNMVSLIKILLKNQALTHYKAICNLCGLQN